MKFFYNFGPNRLEELLQEESDEAIRDFVRNYKVNRIRDIKSEMTTQIKQDLEQKFAPYGVVIEQVSIIKVILPKDLRTCLMYATNYDVYLQKQVKQHKNTLLKIQNECNKGLLQIKRDNIQKIFNLQHEKDVEEINILMATATLETDKITSEINAKKQQATKLIEADNTKQLAELRANAKAELIMAEAKAYTEERRARADNEAEVIKSQA